MKKLFLAITLFLPVLLIAQQDSRIDSSSFLNPIACDCKKAIVLNIGSNNSTYGPTIDTKGYGEVQEIPQIDKLSEYYFETEHNSAWYILKINTDGELTFTIKPINPTNDYDFLLFKYTDSSFCRRFIKKELIPIRSNLSRVNISDSGITGLNHYSKKQYIKRGIGDNYSSSVQVKKGEKFILVLDNVHNGGKGHLLSFFYAKDMLFTGIITNDRKEPMKAEITLTTASGKVIATTTSENETGKFNLKANVNNNQNYVMYYYNDSTFFETKLVKVTPSTHDTIAYKSPIVLQVLKVGKKYTMKNILFIGDSSSIIPSSLNSLFDLYSLMIKHDKMKIRIEGHVNDPGSTLPLTNDQSLSERRALTVCNYLVSMGVKKERLSVIGFANSKMLYPKPKNSSEEQLNRRVEITILSMK